MSEIAMLLVDDDDLFRGTMAKLLARHGHTAREARTCQEAMEIFAQVRPQVAFVDQRLPDGQGLDLVGRFRAIDPNVRVVLISGYADVPLAVRAMQRGAYTVIEKPFSAEELFSAIPELDPSRERPAGGRQAHPGNIPRSWRSRLSAEAIATLKKVVDTEFPVLLTGETGTGKTTLARWLHASSHRSSLRLVEVNCASFSKEFLRSELFGHVRGAFTGAATTKKGLFEVADGSTLFLDEIGDLPLNVQPELLHVIEEGRFRPLGQTEERTVDVRVIAATSLDLRKMIMDGRFRADLFYRLAAVNIELPPLRSRPDEIARIALTIQQELNARHGWNVRLSECALDEIKACHWPGNLRELKFGIARASLTCSDDVIQAEDIATIVGRVAAERIPAEPAAMPDPVMPAHNEQLTTDEPDLTLRELERERIQTVLWESKSITDAAKRLGIARSTLYARIKELDLERSQ